MTKNKKYPFISVCIITYKRPAQLRILLESLAVQTIYRSHKIEIIIVDNDHRGTAKSIVEDFVGSNSHLTITFEIEPEQGIPLARNHSVKLARGDFIAFIDDDEKAAPTWLESLYQCITKYRADAVFGPVEAILPADCPDWLKKGNFYNRPHHKDGTPVIMGRTSNALVRKFWLERYKNPFDPTFRFTGGEDSDLFERMLKQGAKLCWAESAVVYELVGKERLNLKWLLMRAFRGGQGHALRHVNGRNLTEKMAHCVYRSMLAGFALVMSVLSFPFGRHLSVWWLRKVFSNVGQLSFFSPYRYEEYNPKNYR